MSQASRDSRTPGQILEQIARWFRFMEVDGLTLDDLQRSIDSQKLRNSLMASWTKARDRTPSVARYDAGRVAEILGLPCACSDPVPDVPPGEVLIYYGGWDTDTLRDSLCGKWLHRDRNYAGPSAGYYSLLIPVPGSNRKTWTEQLAHLRTFGEQWVPAPVALAVTAVAVHLAATEENLLQGVRCHCADLYSENARTVLDTIRGRVAVTLQWGQRRHARLWLAAARKL